MEPIDFYKQQIQDLESQLKKLQQRKSYFGWLRFSAIAAIIAVFYFLYSLGIWYVIITIILLLVIFTRLLLADLKNKAAITYTAHLININKDELKFVAGDYYGFPDGSQHIPEEHLYANDLDIFGRASLFQYINRSTSEMGSNRLAAYLKDPAEADIILQRQIAVQELSADTQWRQHLQALGREKQILFTTKTRLENWVQEKPVFSQFASWKWLRYLLPFFILSIVTLYIFDIVGSGIFYLSLLIFAVIAFQINKIVAPIHESLLKITDELEVFSLSIKHIETATFESALLGELQMNFIHQNKEASDEIKQLKKILDKLDLRYNLVLSAPLNILLLWNLQQVLDLEKWKSGHQKNINSWFETLGNLEALTSIATLYFNEPQWVFPSIVPEYFFIDGKEIGHPLISKTKQIGRAHV